MLSAPTGVVHPTHASCDYREIPDGRRSERPALLRRTFQLVISDSSVLGLGALDALAITAIVQARDLSLGLWPTVLDDLGLPGALRWLAHQKYPAGSTLSLQLSLDEIGRLPFVVEIACFRIVQEALTNVARHASAGQVQIELRARAGSIEVAGASGYMVKSADRAELEAAVRLVCSGGLWLSPSLSRGRAGRPRAGSARSRPPETAGTASQIATNEAKWRRPCC